MSEAEHPESGDGPAERASFEGFDLLPEVAEALGRMGFEEPTDVQARTYREVMSGRDVTVMSQTGTGKTAAFGIPMAQRLDPGKAFIQALVLAPTRELALQVCRELSAIGEVRGLGAVAVYGGASFTKQVEEVAAGAHVVVGTPGRVLDHLRRGTISFDRLGLLVLDEADEMLSMGFERELSAIIERLPTERQTILFSATIPDDIQRLAARYMREATNISVSGDQIAAKEISHFVYLVSGEGRTRDLVRVIEAERPESAIVFCNTRDDTQIVARALKEAGYDADFINSDLSQAERERVMGATRRGKLRFLVATDVAARGIDISHLSHVMNYTFPESLEVYVHRTGRTGRLGRHGAAISLVAPADIGNLYYLRLTYKIFPVEKVLPERSPAERNLELERMEGLRRSIRPGVDGGILSLARRVIQDVRADHIVAALLEGRLGVSPSPGAEGSADGDEPERKKPSKSRRRGRRRSSGGSGERSEERTDSVAPEPRPADDEPGGSGSCEIFVDAGRKDGLRVSILVKEIAERTGLDRSALGRIRMLTRSTFVSVPEEHFEAVMGALAQIEIDGRPLKAEPAEEP